MGIKAAARDAQRDLDKFYTSAATVRRCQALVTKAMDALGIDPAGAVALEPSAGSGAFLPALRKLGVARVDAMDIAPEGAGIDQGDFLATPYRPDAGHTGLVIGNPPFGRRAKLAIQFINHALDGGARMVAFILPIQMRKWISQRAVREDARLVADIDLPENAFLFDGAPYHANCCFQIWISGDPDVDMTDLRIRTRPETSHPDFDIWQYNRTREALWVLEEDWDFAVLRQGYGDYTDLKARGTQLDPKKQWILFRAKNATVRDRLQSLDFEALSRTNTAVRGFGKTEVVAEYRRRFEGAAAPARAARANLDLVDALSDTRRFLRATQAGTGLEGICDLLGEAPGIPIVRRDGFKTDHPAETTS